MTARVARCAVALLLCAAITGCTTAARTARHLARAEQYFEQAEYEKAKIEYENVLRGDPSKPLVFQRLGVIWLEEGAPFRAAPFLTKACELAPADPVNRTKMATALVLAGRIDDARSNLLAALDSTPTNEEALLLLADTDRTASEADVTEDRLKRFGSPESATVQLVAANLAVQRGDAPAAEIFLQRALAAAPSSAKAHLAMANYRVLRGDTAAVETELRAAAGLSPTRSSTRIAYADFKTNSGAEEQARTILQDICRRAPDYFPAWCRLSRLAFGHNRYDEALSLLDNVLSRDPTNVEAGTLQVDILLARGDTKRAVLIAESLDNTYRDVPALKYQLASTFLRNNDRAQAEAILNQAIALKPDFADAILLLGEMNLQSGNATGVVQSMKRLLEKQPGLARAELLLTEAYMSSGQFDEAAALAQRQAEASPDTPDPYFRLGLILLKAKKVEDARKAFDKVLALRPENLEAINQLVDIELTALRFDAATKLVQDILSRSRDSGVAYFLQGKVLAAQNKNPDAEAALSRALELDPDSLGTHQLLISTYVIDRKIPEAMTQLHDLLHSDPNEPWALETLAEVCEQTGDFAQARDAYEKLLVAAAPSAHVFEKLAKLYSEYLNLPDRAYERALQARTLDPVDPQVADTLGWICYRRKDFAQALTLSAQAVAKLTDDPTAQFHFAMANYMMNQPDAARDALQKALGSGKNFPGIDEARHWLAFLKHEPDAPETLSMSELETLVDRRPNDPVARTRLATLYEKNGDAKKAAAQYEAAVAANPKLIDASLKLAELDAGPLHDVHRALSVAKSARELDRDNPDTARRVASIAFRAGDFAWAYNLLVQCAYARRDDPAVNYDLAWAAYSLGQTAEAERVMRRAIELQLDATRAEDAARFVRLTAAADGDAPEAAQVAEAAAALKQRDDYAPALMVTALDAKLKGDLQRATQLYEKVLQLFPEFAPAQKQLAELYSHGDAAASGKAYVLATKARKKLPADADLARTLGRISYRRNEFEYAAQLLEESARSKPLDAMSLFCLGMALSHLRNDDGSRAALDQSLAGGLPEPFASEAGRTLAAMNKQATK